MSFAEPWWLWAGVLAVGAMLWTWRHHDVRQRAALEQLVSPALRAELTRSASRARVLLRRALFAASIALLFTALAGPRAGDRWEQITRRGNDIIFAVDTSRSMLTPDVKPNRLARAKLAIDDLISRLNGDAVGLVAFAGSAFLQCPITLDYGAFQESLAALDTHVIPRGGTDIASAIREAEAALQHRPGSDKILILVTDGEDLEGDSLAAARAAAKDDGLKIFTVGVGSAAGDLIPLPADQGGGFLRDSEGHLVKSRLDESTLKTLAAATGGAYAPLGVAGQGLDAIYQQALAPLAKHDLESRSRKIPLERYQWPLGAAIALLVCSLLVSTRRRIGAAASLREEPSLREDMHRSSRIAVPMSALVLALCGGLPVHSAHASPASAAVAYQHGNFSAAAQAYAAAAARNPHQPILQYDAGAAAYKAGDYSQAAQAFQASVNASMSGNRKRLAEQEDAYYDLGNTRYREGQKSERSDPTETIRTWTKAVEAYDAALQLRPDDADSQFNRDLVKRRLESLKSAQSQPKTNPNASASQSAGQPKQSGEPQQGAQPNQAGQPQQGGQPQQQGSGNEGSPAGDKSSSAGAQPPQSQTAGMMTATRPRAKADGSPPRAQPDQTASSADDRRVPGEMNREEARELLDSVKDEERRAPSMPVARNEASTPPSTEPLKDW